MKLHDPELNSICVRAFVYAHMHVDALHMCVADRGQHEIWGSYPHHSDVVMPLSGIDSGELGVRIHGSSISGSHSACAF